MCSRSGGAGARKAARSTTGARRSRSAAADGGVGVRETEEDDEVSTGLPGGRVVGPDRIRAGDAWVHGPL